MKGRGQDELSGIALVDAAVALVRESPIGGLAIYYIGALPFVTAAATFWAVMLQSPTGRRDLPLAALGLALLFIWMKVWQARFCRHLEARLSGDDLAPWRIRDGLRSASIQAPIQATGLFVLPACTLAVLPLGWANAFYQNVTVLDDGRCSRVRDALHDAAAGAARNLGQSIIALWLLSPVPLITFLSFFLAFSPVLEGAPGSPEQMLLGIFSAFIPLLLLPFSPVGLVLFANVYVCVLIAAALTKALLGVDTALTLAGGAALNSTLAVAVAAVVFLIMDPVSKAAHVIRCFHGRSLRSGGDLQAALRRCRNGATAILIAAAIFGGSALSAEAEESDSTNTMQRAASSVEMEGLERSLDEELAKRRYTWRMPRPLEEITEEEGWLASTLKRLSGYVADLQEKAGEWIDAFLDWLFGRRTASAGESFELSRVSAALRVFAVVLVVILVLVAAFLLFRAWQQWRSEETTALEEGETAVPDIEDEDTAADALPEEGWLAMARDLFEQGDCRLAVRALFLASLSRLAQHDHVRIARYKSNRDYKRELRRRAHVQPRLIAAFAESAGIYESIWFGDHSAGPAHWQEMMANLERLQGGPPA